MAWISIRLALAWAVLVPQALKIYWSGCGLTRHIYHETDSFTYAWDRSWSGQQNLTQWHQNNGSHNIVEMHADILYADVHIEMFLFFSSASSQTYAKNISRNGAWNSRCNPERWSSVRRGNDMICPINMPRLLCLSLFEMLNMFSSYFTAGDYCRVI